jgi:hypothetical protein
MEERGFRVAVALQVQADDELTQKIQAGYPSDKYACQLQENLASVPGAHKVNGLLFVGDRLVVLAGSGICEQIFHTAHDAMGQTVVSTCLTSGHNS